VKAITVTGTGGAHSEPGARNALGLLALAGQADVPVAMGRETPLRGNHAFPDVVRQAMDNMMGLPLPPNPYPPSQQSAVELLRTVVHNSPQRVSLLALGPLTNIAELLQADPSLLDNLEMIYVMGGAVDVPGNIIESGADTSNKVAEWNIYCDPYAAKLVFHSGAPITLVPLDATNQAPVTEAFYRRLAAERDTPEADFVYQVQSALKDLNVLEKCYFWDPLTAAILTDESLATFEQRTLTVVAEEGPQSGRTLAIEDGASVRVCTAVDNARFERLFLDVLNGRLG